VISGFVQTGLEMACGLTLIKVMFSTEDQNASTVIHLIKRVQSDVGEVGNPAGKSHNTGPWCGSGNHLSSPCFPTITMYQTLNTPCHGILVHNQKWPSSRKEAHKS
jgi:hypothetical protein